MPKAGGEYFDSALVAKFYLNEPGRDVVRALARSAGTVVTAGIAVAEVASAFHRKLRERAIDEKVFAALQGQFAHDLKQELWTLVPVSESLLASVQTLFAALDDDVYLRALDAVHVVAALEAGFAQLYSNDRHLLAACPAVGIRGVNPLARSGTLGA